jgi:HKD family nuclease
VRQRSVGPGQAYVFERKDGTGVAFVGSSNLSESALLTGIEWNYRVVAKTETAAFRQIRSAFDSLFDHPATQKLHAALDRRLPKTSPDTR